MGCFPHRCPHFSPSTQTPLHSWGRTRPKHNYPQSQIRLLHAKITFPRLLSVFPKASKTNRSGQSSGESPEPEKERSGSLRTKGLLGFRGTLVQPAAAALSSPQARGCALPPLLARSPGTRCPGHGAAYLSRVVRALGPRQRCCGQRRGAVSVSASARGPECRPPPAHPLCDRAPRAGRRCV